VPITRKPGGQPTPAVQKEAAEGLEPPTRVKECIEGKGESCGPGRGHSSEVACGLTPPSTTLETGPISETHVTSRFPFSMLAFAEHALSGLVTSPERPNAGFFVFGTEIGDLSFLSHFDGIVGVWRDVVAFFLTIAAALYLWRRTLGR
jgi:hypothetical protein